MRTEAEVRPSPKEQFYDDVIAPQLLAIGEQCQANGISFVATAEYEANSVGLTVHSDDLHACGPQFRLAVYGARCLGNIDKLIASLLADDERHAGPDGSKSLYLRRLTRDPPPATQDRIADIERRLQEAERAIEFAMYLALDAEQLLVAMAAESLARLAHEEAAREDCVLEIRAAEAIERAVQNSSEVATGLRAGIYEFRKRLPPRFKGKRHE